ncbi:MAG: DUF2306 domain-containing protein [Acidobacteriaceae bacterium]
MLPQRNQPSTNVGATPGMSIPIWMRTGFWICIVIALAVVIRRVLALAWPARSGPPQMVELDGVFVSHAALTLAHILPAAAFVILLPLVFLRRFSHLMWPERWLFPLGAIVGLTAYAMSTYSVGGWVERSAVLFYNSLFLFSLAQAWNYKRQGDWLLKRRWLLRGSGVLLGIATTRPVMGVFFATSQLTHLQPQQFFGIAFWIGFSINWIVVESWLWRSRNQGLSY